MWITGNEADESYLEISLCWQFAGGATLVNISANFEGLYDKILSSKTNHATPAEKKNPGLVGLCLARTGCRPKCPALPGDGARPVALSLFDYSRRPTDRDALPADKNHCEWYGDFQAHYSNLAGGTPGRGIYPNKKNGAVAANFYCQMATDPVTKIFCRRKISRR